MTDSTTPAEQIAAHLEALHGEVRTREQVATYRQVRRATDRTVAVLDWRTHTTQAPGLLAQLGVVAATTRPGVITPGAALPGGSPGWDADGALTPIVRGGKPSAEEPISEAWHVAQDIRGAEAALRAELIEQGWAPDQSLVDIALADERTGKRIAARLAGLVQRARIAADYDAPIVSLREVHCPYCGGELRVRADASSAVWCAGRWPVQGPAMVGERWPVTARCGATWDQGGWVRLLAELEAS
ncbi:hypothetical protein ACQEU3_46925 [Spirillospora sp. CA-253888]